MDFLWNLDKSLLSLINQTWALPWLDVFFPRITDLHKELWFQIFFPLFVACLLFWKYRKFFLLPFCLLALAVATTDLSGNYLFKHTLQRTRPADVPGAQVIVRSPYGGYSFPSNHAANLFCIAKFMSEMTPQTRLLFYAAAVLGAYSRVYNGVHYPSDVLGGGILGWLFGWLFSGICKTLLRRWAARGLT